MMRFFNLATATLIAIAVVATTTGTWNTPFASDLVAQEAPARAEKKKASEPSHRSLAEARIRKQLNKPVDLIYDAEAFGDVRAQLSKDLAINIIADRSLEGIMDDDTEVSANLRGIQLGDGLRAMLRGVDATYTIRDGVLLIVSIGEVEDPEFLVRRMIDVRELLKSIKLAEPNRMKVIETVHDGDKKEPKFTPEKLLIETIVGSISPDSWEQNGTGNCAVMCIGGVLVTRTTEVVAEEVQDFVTDLQRKIESRDE